MSLPSVCISQTIRLFELLETNVEWKESVLDIVGYPSSLLPAILVTTSLPAPFQLSSPLPLPLTWQLALLQNVLVIFEVSLLLGVETQVSRQHAEGWWHNTGRSFFRAKMVGNLF